MIKNHTDLINFIAEKIQAKTYLEIGVFNRDHNFNHIKVENKFGVDPDFSAKADLPVRSDTVFELLISTGAKLDLIFIDGLHHADQVKKDIHHAWHCLKIGGVMVIHDCNPPTEATTCVPRGAQREWCGDVYKTICQILDKGKYIFTVDFDYGCCIIKKTEPVLHWYEWPITWDYFDKNRTALLNLVSVEKGIEVINSWNKTTEHAN